MKNHETVTRRVLSVGQCPPDQAAIAHFLERHFDAQVVQADLEVEIREQLRNRQFDLVLVNRKLDADYSDGIEIIARLKQDSETGQVPCMLVSNYPEYQQSAVTAGALYGFGKAELGSPETVARVRQALAERSEPATG